ncbi:unnamed protein product [Linum tenue]|uniref:Secreted protein n=1 Tax=Linum tenue TaxID=586396 RepID=A0AAV0JJ87_9ROSI|nr:unnamed protein product [Linum tenue]
MEKHDCSLALVLLVKQSLPRRRLLLIAAAEVVLDLFLFLWRCWWWCYNCLLVAKGTTVCSPICDLKDGKQLALLATTKHSASAEL